MLSWQTSVSVRYRYIYSYLYTFSPEFTQAPLPFGACSLQSLPLYGHISGPHAIHCPCEILFLFKYKRVPIIAHFETVRFPLEKINQFRLEDNYQIKPHCLQFSVQRQQLYDTWSWMPIWMIANLLPQSLRQNFNQRVTMVLRNVLCVLNSLHPSADREASCAKLCMPFYAPACTLTFSNNTIWRENSTQCFLLWASPELYLLSLMTISFNLF